MTRYCGRDLSFEELEEIRTLIANNPEFTRAKLSREVCRRLQWLKPDGKLKVKKIKFTAATDPQKNSCVYSKSSAKPAPTDGHQSFLVFVE
jgi:hypothetical protein